MTYTEQVQAAAVDIIEHMRQVAAQIEAEGGPSQGTVFNDIARAVRGLKGTSRPGALDGRTTPYRVRLLIFAPDGSLEADSDPDLGDMHAAGSCVVYGLKAVADWARNAATELHHGRDEQITEGLDESYLRHKMNTLRPSMSRAKGRSYTWRLPYKVGEANWLMLVPITRETAKQSEESDE